MLVVGDEAEGERYREFRRVGALGEHGVAGEDGGMFQRHAESGPEAASRDDFAVGGPAVVVGAHCRPGGYVALSAHAGGYEEGVVVVLLVGWEDQVADQLAAGDSAVVAEHRVEEAHASGEGAAGPGREVFGDAASAYAVAGADDAVAEHAAAVDVHRLPGCRAHADAVDADGAVYGACRAALQPFYAGDIRNHAAFSDHRPELTFLREGFQSLLQPAVFGPGGHQKCVGAAHAREGVYAAGAVFVHDLYHGGAESAFCGHLPYIEEQAVISDSVAGEEADVVDGAAVGYGA